MGYLVPVEHEGQWHLGIFLDAGEEMPWGHASDEFGRLNGIRANAGLPELMGFIAMTASGQHIKYYQGDAWVAVGGPTVTIGGFESYTGHRLGYPEWGSQFIIRPDTPGEGIDPTQDPQ